jgi:hypothetical protein
LFGQIAADIKDKKHLIVVPSGALTSLPFQVLITEKPEGTQRLSDAAWLIKRHAITVLPSVASLRALRAFAKRTRTGKPFIGFISAERSGMSARCAISRLCMTPSTS